MDWIEANWQTLAAAAIVAATAVVFVLRLRKRRGTGRVCRTCDQCHPPERPRH